MDEDKPKAQFWNDIVRLQDGEKARVRIYDTSKAKSFWTHRGTNSAGRFIDVLCTRYEGGCILCDTNFSEKHAHLKGGKRPYASRKRCVKPVWVYEIKSVSGSTPVNRVMLMQGVEIWSGIDEKDALHGANSTMEADLIVMRVKTEIRTKYTVGVEPPSPFEIEVKPDMVPTQSLKEYMEYLKSNIDRTVLIDEDWTPPTEDSETPGNPVPPPAKQSVPPPPAPKPATPPASSAPRSKKDEVLTAFTDYTDLNMNVAILAECMKTVNPNSSELDEFSEQDVVKLHKLYLEKYEAYKAAKAKK